MAYSISVAVGDTERIEVGRLLMCTAPLAVVTVTGNAPLAAALLAPAVLRPPSCWPGNCRSRQLRRRGLRRS